MLGAPAMSSCGAVELEKCQGRVTWARPRARGRREGDGIARRRARWTAVANFGQTALHGRNPAPDHVFQKPVKLRTVRHAAFVTQIKRITDEGHSALLHCHRPTETVSLGSADQHLISGDTAARRPNTAGHPHNTSEQPRER